MDRPLIGITAARMTDTHGLTRCVLREEYPRAVESAGGLAVLLPCWSSSDTTALVSRLDGLVLSGGGDLDPSLFGAAPRTTLRELDRERDEFEIALTREALRCDLPILGICRGIQVLNVAMGGTLLQDIASTIEGGGTRHDREDGQRVELAHDVEIAPGSALEWALGTSRLSVNSLHHQALDTVADGLQVSAVCPADGVIEAIEAPQKRFTVGVQWHPEAFWREPSSPSLMLFQALMEAAGGRVGATSMERASR